jgi:hypothetical protein
MEVRLPDGTIIKDVPEGTTKAQLVEKLKANGMDVSGLQDDHKKDLIKDFKERGWGTGLSKLGYDIGGKVTDHAVTHGTKPGLAAALGFGTNVLTQALPAALTSVQGPSSLLEKPARWLMQTAVKPSSTLPPKKVAQAMGTMLNEPIYPTMSGMEKATKIAGGIDDQVDDILANSQATTNVARIGSRLREPFEAAKTQVNPLADMKAVRSVWDEFKVSPLVMGKTEIPVKAAHEIKKGTYAALGKKSFNEIGSASIEAQKALARGAREEVAAAVPEVKHLLGRQADMMNVKEVAGTRALIESNKNPLGHAALRMDNPLSAMTFWADRLAALKAFMAIQAHSGSKMGVLAPAAITADTQDEEIRGLLGRK